MQPNTGRASFMSARALFARYVTFAVLASLVNLLTQQVAVQQAPQAPVVLSVLLGTAAGFVTKYILDKRWIFSDNYEAHAAELRKIVVYGLSSVSTTLIFWGTELGAWQLWGTTSAKYTGAVAGLAIGNWLKYQLDKRWVFRRTG